MSPRSNPLITAVSLLPLALGGTACPKNVPEDVYTTYGVHNSEHSEACESSTCAYTRGPGEPTDPQFPEYWTSDWTMYRVYANYQDNMPPYEGRPPAALVEGRDYEVSYGTTWYDSTWNGGQGAIMEYYDKRCLPIFPIDNHYSCSFISLGDAAFFVTYEADRPQWMPEVCLFSPRNHLPRPDFIKHLPYSKSDSERLGGKVQSYGFWVSAETSKRVQTGVSPDRTQQGDIMFGYAFYSEETPDRVQKDVAPYRHPHSFFFSGDEAADAPIISQNYTHFARVRPEPAKTWDLVSGLDPQTLPKCQLFNPPSEFRLTKPGRPARSWGHLGRKR